MLVLGLVDIPWWGILIILIIVFLMFETRDFDYFKKQGIPGPRPYPIVGTAYTLFTMALPDEECESLKRYGDKPCFGEFFGSNQPALVVYDEGMLSEIMVEQFSAFSNRIGLTADHPIIDGMLFNLEDARWKYVRNAMTPIFTTGKLKRMNTEVNRCAKTLADSLLECAKDSGEMDTKEYTAGYVTDVIAGTAFGIQADSMKDRNNAFVDQSRRALTINMFDPVVILIIFFPLITKLLNKMGFGINLFSSDLLTFFPKVIHQAVEMAKSEDVQSRTSVLQFMIKAEKGEKLYDEDKIKDEDAKTAGDRLTADEIMGNAIMFFIAGNDSTSDAISFFLYNMAVHPDIQDKLVQEITAAVGDKDDIDASVIQEMRYLDQCVNENMRLYPPALRINRRVTRDVTIKGVYIKKGLMIQIPIFAIHRDPNKWPDPEKFDPDRFLPENRKNRNPYHYLPFGNGPRICIGSRLALQQLKVAIIHILRKVKVSTCQKTQIPLVFEINPALMKPAGGIHLKVELREQS